MSLRLLDRALFHDAILFACHALVAQQESLNAINVFPVADGDTGNNMAGTAMAIINHAEIRATLQLTCKSIADASILGARGNSGMIFSEFFNGFVADQITAEQLDTRQFATMMMQAAHSARAAVLKPVEGTILTVMEAFGRSLKQQTQKIDDFFVLIPFVLEAVHAALETTRTTLDVLKKAHVVDAGAMGFSIFVDGFFHFIKNPTALPVENPATKLPGLRHDDLHVDGPPPDARYCTEAILYGEALDKSSIQNLADQYGNSVVLTGNPGLCRIHLHCNEPWLVFSALKKQGAIRYPKVDDMLAQYRMLHHKNKKIALMTDTGADLPQTVADDYLIHFIPVNVHMDGHDLLDKFSINPDTFYDEMAASAVWPVTSFPSLKQIEDKMRQVAALYDHVLVCALSQALSGTHDALLQVARRYPNVHVVNTRFISGAQGLLVNYAAELIADGASIGHVKQALEAQIEKTRFFVVVPSMDALIRSGRIGKLMGRFAQWVGLKPVLSIDKQGKMSLAGKTLREHTAFLKLIHGVQETAKKMGGLANYCIVHAGAPEKARALAILATDAFGEEPAYIEAATISVGLHAGKGSVALAALFKSDVA